jgi:hypothetical protein
MVSMSRPPPPCEYFFERFPWNNRWILFGLAVLVSGFDFLATQVLLFPILFLIPVLLMAWNCGLRTALWLGAVLCAVRLAVQFSWGVPYPPHIVVINGLTRLGILFLLIWLVAKLSEQTLQLRTRVRTLEGILPTCSFCKNIRDEDGHWHQMEAYVARRAEVRFTHGVCPACANHHYGDFMTSAEPAPGPPP